MPSIHDHNRAHVQNYIEKSIYTEYSLLTKINRLVWWYQLSLYSCAGQILKGLIVGRQSIVADIATVSLYSQKYHYCKNG